MGGVTFPKRCMEVYVIVSGVVAIDGFCVERKIFDVLDRLDDDGSRKVNRRKVCVCFCRACSVLRGRCLSGRSRLRCACRVLRGRCLSGRSRLRRVFGMRLGICVLVCSCRVHRLRQALCFLGLCGLCTFCLLRGERFLCSVLLVCRSRCLGLLGLAFFCLTFFRLACFLRCRGSGRAALLRGAAAFSRIAAACLGLLWRFGWLIFLFLVLCRDWGQRIAHLVASRLIDIKAALIDHCEGVPVFVVGDVFCEVKFPLPHCQHQVRRVISLIVRSNEVDRPQDHGYDQQARKCAIYLRSHTLLFSFLVLPDFNFFTLTITNLLHELILISLL